MEQRCVDDARLDALITRYSDMVYRLAVLRCHTKEDAEDVYQEVFIKLVRYAAKLEDEEHVKAWLIRVTINQCNSLYTSSWKQRNRSLDELHEQGAEPAAEDEGLMAISEDNGILDAVRALKPAYRDVIYLFYYEDMSIRSISAALHTTETNVKVRLNRARNKLKEILEKKGAGPYGRL